MRTNWWWWCCCYVHVQGLYGSSKPHRTFYTHFPRGEETNRRLFVGFKDPTGCFVPSPLWWLSRSSALPFWCPENIHNFYFTSELRNRNNLNTISSPAKAGNDRRRRKRAQNCTHLNWWYDVLWWTPALSHLQYFTESECLPPPLLVSKMNYF